MDDDKDDKPLFQKAIEIVKDVANSVTEVVKSAPPSERMEAANPEENFDAPPMTAEELAHHAAAENQPVIAAKKTPKKKAFLPSLSGRITPTYDFPVPDTPMPAPKKRKTAVKKAKRTAKKSAKAAKKKTVKKAVKKSKAKKAVTKSHAEEI